jgi:hypothetical protein
MAFTPALRKTARELYIVGSAIHGQQMFETALLHQCAYFDGFITSVTTDAEAGSATGPCLRSARVTLDPTAKT